MAQVKAILFDYGMVLSGPPDPKAWAHMLTITGLSEDLLHKGYWENRHAYDRGDLNAKAFWDTIAAGGEVLLTPSQLTQLIDADTELWSSINPPMLAWVQSLQRAGIRTGILSNMGDAMETGLRSRHPWIADFDHHTWSHNLNIAKPEPAIYRHAAEGMATPAENILFIDDKAENIEAAIAAGMQAIQYTSHAAFEQEMRSRGLDYLLQPQSSGASHDATDIRPQP